MKNDSGSKKDTGYSRELYKDQFDNALKYVAGNGGNRFNLNTYNCTDFSMGTMETAGVKMPDAKGSWAFGMGSGNNPGVLGENLKQMYKDDKGQKRKK